MRRKIVQIDEAKCDGCGECIPSCAEGAIALVDGKARLVGDVLCDGLGACLGDCPQGAITVIEREAAAFDEAAVAAHLAKVRPGAPAPQAAHAPPPAPTPARPRLSVLPGGATGATPAGGCPGSAPRSMPGRTVPAARGGGALARGPVDGESRLAQWPVQLHLVPVQAPFFDGADLLVAADCVPFAYARFHEDFLAGHALVVGCPKLDDVQAYGEKLGQIFARNAVKSVTVLRMEVPCCGGIAMAARHGIAASGKSIPLRDVVIGVDGEARG